MQWQAQKKGQPGVIDAAAEVLAVLANGLESADEDGSKLGCVPRAPIRELGFGQLPDAFVRIQFGSVARETDEVKTANAMAELLNQSPSMGSSAVPEQEYVATQMA